MIEAKQIFKSYGNLQVLKGVDVSVNRAEIVSLVGASGAGKSTLLQILGTLDKPDSGTIKIDGASLVGLRDKELSSFRNKKIGFVFQFHHLLPEFTAVENVCIPAFLAGQKKADATRKAHELLDFMGLQNRFKHKPGELSGGEQQRVAIARALINNPAVVLADEPTGNLDSDNSSEIHNLFFKLRDAFDQTFLIVTHNQKLAGIADRQLMMKDGLII